MLGVLGPLVFVLKLIMVSERQIYFKFFIGWSFQSLYGSRLESTCPLASASVVLVNSNPNNVSKLVSN